MDMMDKLMGNNDNLFRTKTAEDRKESMDKMRKVEILYYSKGSKEGATFEQFLELIPGLSHLQYPELKNKVEEN